MDRGNDGSALISSMALGGKGSRFYIRCRTYRAICMLR